MDNEIKIFLSPFEAEMFKSWQSFHATFELMVKQGVFEIKNGSATIHFDNNGCVQKIERHDSLFDARVQKLD